METQYSGVILYSIVLVPDGKKHEHALGTHTDSHTKLTIIVAHVQNRFKPDFSSLEHPNACI
jgi:hypothetical protein